MTSYYSEIQRQDDASADLAAPQFQMGDGMTDPGLVALVDAARAVVEANEDWRRCEGTAGGLVLAVEALARALEAYG